MHLHRASFSELLWITVRGELNKLIPFYHRFTHANFIKRATNAVFQSPIQWPTHDKKWSNAAELTQKKAAKENKRVET